MDNAADDSWVPTFAQLPPGGGWTREEADRFWRWAEEWNRLTRERHRRDEEAGKNSKGQRRAKKRS